MFSTPRYNPYTEEIASRLEKAGIDLINSNFGNPIWHMYLPKHDVIIQELKKLAQSQKDPLKHLLIASEIVTLSIMGRDNALRSLQNEIQDTNSTYDPEETQSFLTLIDEEADALYTSSSQAADAEQDGTVKPFGESTEFLPGEGD